MFQISMHACARNDYSYLLMAIHSFVFCLLHSDTELRVVFENSLLAAENPLELVEGAILY